MRSRRVHAVVCSLLALGVISARVEARRAEAEDDARATRESAAAGVREMFVGTSGARESWKTLPSLVVVTTVMDYASGDVTSGFTAVDEQLTPAEITQLTRDLSRALGDLTGGVVKDFRGISTECATAGQLVKVLRPGQIVVGRFRGVQAKTGNLGYGSRMTRNGTIAGAAVMLDAAFDRTSDQRSLLRTHELGHALGFHHVESRASVMNPRVGSSLTDFDRAAVRMASIPLVAQF